MPLHLVEAADLPVEPNAIAIETLALSTRAYNALSRPDQPDFTIRELAALSDEELLALPRLGPGVLAEIRHQLAAFIPREINAGDDPGGDPDVSDVEHPPNEASTTTPLDLSRLTYVAEDVPIGRIRPNPHNPRRIAFFDDPVLQALSRNHPTSTELQDLHDSILAHGLLQLPAVRPVLDDPDCDFELIAGERRWRAHALEPVIPLISLRVFEGVTDAESAQLVLVENLQRLDLDPLAEARGYQQLRALGMTERAIAEAVNRSQPAIANALRLLTLPTDVQARIAEKELSASHGIALAKWSDFPRICSRIAELAISRGTSAHELEKSLPFADALVSDKDLALDLNLQDWYVRHAPRAPCQDACPLGAYRKGQTAYGGAISVCLAPAHVPEVRAAVEQLAAQEHAAAIAALDALRAQPTVTPTAPAAASPAGAAPAAGPPDGESDLRRPSVSGSAPDAEGLESSPALAGPVTSGAERAAGSDAAPAWLADLERAAELALLDAGEIDETTGIIIRPDADLPRLSLLPSDAYRVLPGSATPAGCTETCACRRIVLDDRRPREGEPPKSIDVCIDLARLTQIEQAAQKAQAAAALSANKQLAEDVRAAVNRIQSFGPRELAVLVVSPDKLPQINPPARWRLAFARHGLQLPEAQPGRILGSRELLDELAEDPELALLRALIEGMLLTEISDRYDLRHELTEWYVGRQPSPSQAAPADIPDNLAARVALHEATIAARGPQPVIYHEQRGAIYPGQRWRYGLTHRPADIYNIPPHWIRGSEGRASGFAHGTIDYARELTPQEIEGFELTPLGAYVS